MSVNSDRLKESVNIVDVVNAVCDNVVKKGDAYFFRCPNPFHEDIHASCYCKEGWKNIHCNSCGYHVQAIDLLQDVRRYSFQEACDELARIAGNPDWYNIYHKDNTKACLTPTELSYLGLRGVKNWLASEDQYKKIVLKAYQTRKNRGDNSNEFIAIEKKILKGEI